MTETARCVYTVYVESATRRLPFDFGLVSFLLQYFDVEVVHLMDGRRVHGTAGSSRVADLAVLGSAARPGRASGDGPCAAGVPRTLAPAYRCGFDRDFLGVGLRSRAGIGAGAVVPRVRRSTRRGAGCLHAPPRWPVS